MNAKFSQSVTGHTERDYTEVRRWPRYHVDVRLRATVVCCGKETCIYGRGGDLSQGGMAAFLPVDLAVGELLQVDLTLPYTSQPVSITAEIRNVSGFKYGLEFRDITPAQQELIVRTCSTLSFVQ